MLLRKEMLVILIFSTYYTLNTINLRNYFKNDEERISVIQRLTALWAFAESGLGGVLHALQVPFTGLIVGGIAMIIITLIATISKQFFNDLVKAFLVVVVVKLTISPYTPITAYVALLFQSMLGYFIYQFFSINFISIFFFCCIAMLESALQKILLLVLFYGKNLYIATNDFINFILKQFSIETIDASLLILVSYLIIYFLGGIFIAIVTNKIIHSPLNRIVLEHVQIENLSIEKKKKNKQPLTYLILAVLLAMCIYFFNKEKSTNFKILYSLVFSFSVIVFWYFILTPFFTKQVSKFLKTKEYKLKEDIHATLNFIPTLQNIIKISWQQTKADKGLHRISAFITIVFSWIILHQHQPVLESKC